MGAVGHAMGREPRDLYFFLPIPFCHPVEPYLSSTPGNLSVTSMTTDNEVGAQPTVRSSRKPLVELNLELRCYT